MKKSILTFMTLFLATMAQAETLPVYLDETKSLEQRVGDALSRMTLDEKIAIIHAQSKFSSPGVQRLGIPDLWTDDGPHGVRPDVLWDEWEQAGQTNDSCVAFPALTCLAATWNPVMARIYGESLGEEALYRGKNVILGPGVNIYRTPLGGRNFEYMGDVYRNKLLIDHELIDGYVRLPIVNISVSENTVIPLYDIRSGKYINRKPNAEEYTLVKTIIDLYESDKDAFNQVNDAFISHCHQLSSFCTISNWWDMIQSSFSITPVGRVLAHANAQRYDKGIPDLKSHID